MNKTMILLKRAMEKEPNAARLCKSVGMARTSLHVAKKKGHLTPVLAGNLAAFLGEDVHQWIVIAAIESAPETDAKDRLKKTLDYWRRR